MELCFAEHLRDRLKKEYQEFIMDRETITLSEVDALDLVLPNASVGKKYCSSVSIPTEGTVIVSACIEGEKAEEAGMTVSVAEPPNRVEIEGRPLVHGSFELKISYRYKDQPDDRPALTRRVPLFINPDPRSLWKNVPVDPGIDYFKEDAAAGYVRVPVTAGGEPQKDIVAASKRGRSHAQEGNPRDDDFRIAYMKETGWYILAVADGAGSAKYSREGSKIACETVLGLCREMLQSPDRFEENIGAYLVDEESARARKMVGDDIYRIVGNAVFRAHGAIRKEAEQKGAKLKDYATTLLLAICKKFDKGWFVASFWVGDGAMCLYDATAHSSYLLGTPDEGEFAGQTRFLTMPEIFRDTTSFYQRLRFRMVPDFTALLMMTDGVSDPKFETDANLQNPAKWDALWQDLKENGVELTDDNEESARQLSDWLDFWSPGNHDDRTIAILY